MSVRGITLVRGTVVVLALDGTLCYVEDVTPVGAAIVALPEQPPERKDSAIFTPGRVGAKKISPFSEGRVVPVTALSERNRNFIGDYEKLRAQHGPLYVQRTPEEEAALSVTKAQPTPRAPRSSSAAGLSRAERRAQRKAAKVPCTKCGLLPVHASHQSGGSCEYEGPAPKTRGKVSATKSSSGGNPTYRVVHEDLTTLQAENDKFAQGNRFFRVFRALCSLPDKTGTVGAIMVAIASDGGRPMTNPEKVTRRALKQLVTAGNVVLA